MVFIPNNMYQITKITSKGKKRVTQCLENEINTFIRILLDGESFVFNISNKQHNIHKKMYLWYIYDLKGMMTTMVFVDNTVTINIILDE